MQSNDHWQTASRRWQHVVPPHCPTEQDMEFSGGVIASWAREFGAPRAIILGMTPQLYHMPWPAGTDLVAMDNNASMIENVWPGPPEAAILDDWTTTQIPENSRDIAITDGGLNVISYPSDVMAVFATLRRVLVPGGLFVARLYVPPSKRETLDSVMADLCSGKISNVSLLKTRLWMAMQEDVEHGVAVADIWDAFIEREPDLPGLATRIGWDVEHMCALNSYNKSRNHYHFFTVDAVRQWTSDAAFGFTLESSMTPTYEQGELCPSIVLRRTDID